MNTVRGKILLLERMQIVLSGTLTFPLLEEQELDIADMCPPLPMASPLIKKKNAESHFKLQIWKILH